MSKQPVNQSPINQDPINNDPMDQSSMSQNPMAQQSVAHGRNPEAAPSTPSFIPPPSTAPQQAGWQPLPRQARQMFMLSGLLAAIPFALVGRLVTRIFNLPFSWTTTAVVAAIGAIVGVWIGYRRYRYTHWALDPDGFSLRKGKLWESEIRVPMNRVQHLDLRRGPLERRYGLATLVIHTAGTRNSAVNVGGLADADAESLRDLLSRQAEHDLVTAHVPEPHGPIATAPDSRSPDAGAQAP